MSGRLLNGQVNDDALAAQTARSNAEAAAALVAGLWAAGVRAAVVCPGSRSTPVALALAARSALRLWVAVDERAAGFLALGLARGLGGPVALLCTSGSAPLHFGPALAEAAITHTPLVVLTADRPAELHGVGAPQTLDQRRIFGTLTPFARDLAAPDGRAPAAVWAQAAQAAVAAAVDPAGGPAHLNLAFREPLWLPDLGSFAAPAGGGERLVAAAPSLDPAALRALAAALAAHPRGVIHVGPHAGVEAARLGPAVWALAARLGWPVLAEAASGARLGAPPGAVVTAYEALARSARFTAAHRPTALLRLGRAPHSRAVEAWLRAAAPAWAVGVDAAGDRHDPAGLLGAVAAAEPVGLLWALVAALDELPRLVPDSGWGAAFAAAEVRARAALDAAASEGFWAAGVARGLGTALATTRREAPGALQVASSMAYRDLDAWLPALPAPGFAVHASRGLNGIDGTVSTAVGLALAAAPAPSAVLLGDLAALHDLGGLVLAGDLRPPLTAVVVDNGGGAIFDHLPIAAHPEHERLFRTPQPRADLVALARGAGLRAAAVGRADEYAAALTEALGSGGPAAVVARIDAADDAARHRAAWRAAVAAIEEHT